MKQAKNIFEDTMKVFNNFKNKQQEYEVIFVSIIKCVYSESVFNTLYIEIKQKSLKNFLQTKYLTHHSFTFKLCFLYELKYKVCLSKTVWDFPFSTPFCFY